MQNFENNFSGSLIIQKGLNYNNRQSFMMLKLNRIF